MTGVYQKLENQDLRVVEDTHANVTCGILIVDADLNCSVMESNVNVNRAGRVVLRAGGRPTIGYRCCTPLEAVDLLL